MQGGRCGAAGEPAAIIGGTPRYPSGVAAKAWVPAAVEVSSQQLSQRMHTTVIEEIASLPEIRGYQVVETLGAGGMGMVYRAVQVSTGREVALKILKNSVVGSPNAVARFKREVQLAARLEHPNIARVYDADVQQGHCFYSMQLIHGLPLHDFVAEHRLSRRQILELLLLVCRGVAYAHEQGVVHRDLKPSNIFVNDAGVPFLLDFGLAKAVGNETLDVAISMEGTVTGTPGFMAPEQAAGQISRIGTATDVYSLGAILYYLLTRHFPHDVSGTQYEMLRRIAEEDVTPPDVYAAGLTPRLTALLRCALQNNPEKRFAHAGELAAEIGTCLQVDTTDMDNGDYAPRRGMWPWWVAAGMAVVVAIVTVSLAITAANERQKAADAPAGPAKKAAAGAGKTNQPGLAEAGGPGATDLAQRQKKVWTEGTAKLQAVRAKLALLLLEHLAEYSAAKPLHLPKQPTAGALPSLDVWVKDQVAVFKLSHGRTCTCKLEQLEPHQVARYTEKNPLNLDSPTGAVSLWMEKQGAVFSVAGGLEYRFNDGLLEPRRLADYSEDNPLHLYKPPEPVVLPELDVWLEKHDVIIRTADGQTTPCDVEKVELRTGVRILMVVARKHPQDVELQQVIDTLHKHPLGRDPTKPRLTGEPANRN